MDHQDEIAAKRDAAARARRLLAEVFDPAMRSKMQAFAAELAAEVVALEQSSQAAPLRRVTQIQMQVQHGPPAKPTNDDETDDPTS